MAKKQRKQHESVGVSDEVMDLLTDGVDTPDDIEPVNPFVLPDARKHKLPPVKTESKTTTEEEKIATDTEYARNNIYELIEHGMAAIQDIAHLAREQMHPRTYEVLSKLMKEVTENNISLIELANQKKAALAKGNKQGDTPPDPSDPKQITNNNNIDKAIFVGSSADLLKLLKDQAENKNDNN